MLQIERDFVGQNPHGFRQQSGFFHDLNRFCRRNRIQNPHRAVPVDTGSECRRRHDLTSGIRVLRMRVHNAACNLDKLADMRDKQQALRAKVHSHIDDLTDIIAALDCIPYRHIVQLVQIMFPVVSKRDDQIASPQGKLLLHFDAETV